MTISFGTQIVGCAEAKFGGIFVCIGFDEHEMHFDLPRLTYNDVYTGVYCAMDHRVGTKAFYECITDND